MFTDTTPDEGYLGEDVEQRSVHLHVPGKRDRVIACSDLYSEQKYYQRGVTKSARDALFNQRLFARVNAFSEIAQKYDLPDNVNADQAALTKVIEGEMFHETYHHTEQAEMDVLSNPEGIALLVQLARSVNAAYMYGMILDIYTQRMLCNNCNACLLGLQHTHEEGFLNDLSVALKEQRIQPRNGGDLMLSTRVSASQAGKGSRMHSLTDADDKGVVHLYDADDTPRVFQARNRALGTERILNQEHPTPDRWGSLFASQTFPKEKFEKTLDELIEKFQPPRG